MKRTLRLGVVAVLAGYPVVLGGSAVREGIGISQDSASYLAAAESLARGDGLLTFTGAPLTLFPPGLSSLIATGEVVGGGARTAAVFLNLVCLALIVVGTYVLGRVSLARPWGAVAAAAVVSLSASFMGVFAWLWSEPPFTLAVLGLLLLLTWAVRTSCASWWVVTGSCVLVGLACSIRYVGLALVVVAALGVWLSAKARGRGPALARAAVTVLFALVVPALLVWRNLDAGAGPLGERVPGSRTMQGAFADLVSVLGGFLLPPDSSSLGPIVGAVAMLLVLATCWLAWLARDRVVALIAVFVIIYGLAMVWSQATTRLDAPSARLLAPAVPALAVMWVYAAGRILDGARSQVVRWAQASESAEVRQRAERLGQLVPAVAASLIGAVLVVASVSSAVRLAVDGPVGSLEPRAAASELVDSLRGLPEGAGVATNDPWTVFVGLGRPPVLPLPPSPSEWPETLVQDRADALVAAAADGRVSYAAVFDDAGRIDALARLEARGVSVTPVMTTADGTLYRLAKAS